MKKPKTKSKPEPTTSVTTIRIPSDIKNALAQAAKDDGRSSANLLMLVARNWLIEAGYLPE
jgi:hypothetical protein